jgi:hypothetical protein
MASSSTMYSMLFHLTSTLFRHLQRGIDYLLSRATTYVIRIY